MKYSTSGTMGIFPTLELLTDAQLMISRLGIVQTVVSGCCDLIAQCIMVRINHCTYMNHPCYSLKSSKIYRCWIVWDQNIRFVIIPSLMSIAYIGQSLKLSSSDKPISIYCLQLPGQGQILNFRRASSFLPVLHYGLVQTNGLKDLQE